MAAQFTPKQAMPRDDKLYKIVGADSTASVAEHEISLLPAFPEDAVIHDAACGLGAVTQAIMAVDPPKSIKITATDIAPQMLNIYDMFSQMKGWGTKAQTMDCQNLEFKDEVFTHSFLSFGLPILSDPVAATKEMYRTLKPGGIAVTAFWLSIPHGQSGGETRRALWGPDAENAIEPDPRHTDPTFNAGLLKAGGFTEGVETYTKTVTLAVKDIDEFATAMWSAIGEPKGGWTQEDEDRWDEVIAAYKKVLMEKPGYKVDEDGNISMESVAQIAIVRKAAT